jgi:hypothetical protein
VPAIVAHVAHVAPAVPGALLRGMLGSRSAHIKPLFPGSLDMPQVIFRARAWTQLNRCELRAWRLGSQGREEIECASALEPAG